jgi:hypothetical protein
MLIYHYLKLLSTSSFQNFDFPYNITKIFDSLIILAFQYKLLYIVV